MSSIDLTLVIVTSLVSALNLYSLGIFILIFAYILGSNRRKTKYLLVATYIFAFFVVNLLAGLFFGYFLNKISDGYFNFITWLVAVLAAGFGLMQLKQYFWNSPKVGLNFTSNFTRDIKKKLKKDNFATSLLIIGAQSAIIVMPFTLISFMALMLSFNPGSFSASSKLTLIYNLIYIIPLIAIMISVMNKTKISTVKNWIQKNKQLMKLAYSVFSISLSWILFLSIRGTIDLG